MISKLTSGSIRQPYHLGGRKTVYVCAPVCLCVCLLSYLNTVFLEGLQQKAATPGGDWAPGRKVNEGDFSLFTLFF